MFHVKHEGWEAAGALGVHLDDSAIAQLEGYEALLRDRALPMGMVASSDAERLRERHLLDCLRAAPLLPDHGTVADLGSGAGLPGVVLAIARPDLRFVLVEVRRNRASLLTAATETLANVAIHARRLETFREPVDACTARAFGPPAVSWIEAERLLGRDGRLIYWAGRSFDAATDTPPGAALRLFRAPSLARSGPLAIMTRQ